MCCGFGIVLWSSLKFDASPTYDSVVLTVVRLEAFTIKWTFCFLPAVAARVMILVWGCRYFESICFLRDAMMVFMFGMHE